jgi:hypothetical protein
MYRLVVEALDPNDSSKEGWENEMSLYMQEVIYVTAQTNYVYNDLKQYL